jgi:hypothetical protein
MHLARTAGTTLAWAVTALVVAALAGPGGVLPFSRVALDRPALSITGNLGGIEPGVPAPLVLTVRNGSSVEAVVHRVSARAIGSSSAGCPREALHIEPWAGEVRVPAHGAVQAPLRLLLAQSAVRCGSVTWELAYTSS